MLLVPKRHHRLRLPGFSNIAHGSPFHLFLASCGNDTVQEMFQKIRIKPDEISLPPEFASLTRGTPHHYLRLLGHDSNLEFICRKLGNSL